MRGRGGVALGALLLGLVVLAGLAVAGVPGGGEADERLRVEGALVVDADGERYTFRGATLYVVPFYLSSDGWADGGLSEETRRAAGDIEVVLDRMATAGLNSVRVPLGSAAWESDAYSLTQSEWLDRLERVAQAADERDMQVVLAWWDALSLADQWPERYHESFPMMQAVHERLGRFDNVIVEPMNEPVGVSWEQWHDATAATVRFWREQLGYQGVLVLDTRQWSWEFDPEHADRMLEVDAALRGEPNLLFANHRYANDNSCFCGDELAEWERKVGRYVDEYPIVVTELGNYNEGWEPSPRWVEEFSTYLAEEKVPAGLNGIFLFTWRWSDPNSMTERDLITLTSFGKRVLDNLGWRETAAGSDAHVS